MAHNPDETNISKPLDLSREAFAVGSNVRAKCCGLADEGGAVNWVTAAELVYEFTGNPGAVVRNLITFELGGEGRIEINLIDGTFVIFQSGNAGARKGRKGIELLMLWKEMSFVEAIEYIAAKYSPEQAIALGDDFVRMKV